MVNRREFFFNFFFLVIIDNIKVLRIIVDSYLSYNVILGLYFNLYEKWLFWILVSFLWFILDYNNLIDSS